MKQKRSTGRSPLVRLVGWHAGQDAATTVTTPPESGHRLAPGIASAAAVAATGLLGPAALAAPGDLDPSFADVGRWSGPDLDGPLWSLDVQDDAILFGGGEEYCYCGCDLYDFTGRLLADGTIDTDSPGRRSPGHRVRHGTAERRQGRRRGACQRPDGAVKAQVFRLLPNGSLDASIRSRRAGAGRGCSSVTETGRSVIVEPDGRIVVAGRAHGRAARRPAAGRRSAGSGVRRRRQSSSGPRGRIRRG